jgi:aminoglycoside phosphotransferase (APT) family kinase protein
MEAGTMQFVAKHTSIPVPKVHCAFVCKGRAYMVMKRIQGRDLPRAWKELSDKQKNNVFEQLRKMMDKLRSLKPPVGMVGVQSVVFVCGTTRVCRTGIRNLAHLARSKNSTAGSERTSR